MRSRDPLHSFLSGSSLKERYGQEWSQDSNSGTLTQNANVPSGTFHALQTLPRSVCFPIKVCNENLYWLSSDQAIVVISFKHKYPFIQKCNRSYKWYLRILNDLRYLHLHWCAVDMHYFVDIICIKQLKTEWVIPICPSCLIWKPHCFYILCG